MKPVETGVGKPIEQIQVGEMVLARNEFEPHGPLELKRVEEFFTRTSPIIELEISGQKIGTTDEHPFYVPAREAFVPARELQVGDQLVSHDGRLLRIDAIHSTLQIATVYNLRVADYHTYFVGCDEWGWSVWAHNAKCTPEEIITYAEAYATAVRKNGGKVPPGVWSQVAVGRNFAEADKSAIRRYIRSNSDQFSDVKIMSRGMGGPIGKESTRSLEANIAQHVKKLGWKLENGAGSGKKQEWISGTGPGRTSGTAIDSTIARIIGKGQIERARIQTVSTLADGKTPTKTELAAANRILKTYPNDKLILIPKGADRATWELMLNTSLSNKS